jgi:hypothetical protein
MSNLLSELRGLIVGVPKASPEQSLPIVDSPVGFTPQPLAVTRRKYARGPLKGRGGRARARRDLRDERGRFLLVVVCALIAAQPLCGRAQDDWREIPSSAAPTKTTTGAQDSNTVTQDSDSPSLGPMTATGTISGLRSGGNPEMDLRLRPQPNGFLHGELVIHQSGFGMTPIDGHVRGNHLQFQVPYGNETYYFEGARRSDELSGTFESTPSGERGTWSVRAD